MFCQPPGSTLFPYTTLFRSAIAVLVAVAVAVTLLPALLGFVGLNIDRLHLGRRARRDRQGMWRRWATFVQRRPDRKSTRLNSSHVEISYAVFRLKKKQNTPG